MTEQYPQKTGRTAVRPFDPNLLRPQIFVVAIQWGTR